MTGHWINLNQSDDWSYNGEPLSGQPDYAYYKFWWWLVEEYVGEGYHYWDLDWPEWALHQCPDAEDRKVFINIDFVDTVFPPE